MKRIAAPALVLAVLAGCVSAPPPVPTPTFDAAAALAAVRAAGAPVATEVEVQPIQDAAVADLREQARAAVAAGRLDAAVVALDHALVDSPSDPTVLQERAELALLDRRLDAAHAFATRARVAGPTLGPLCRRTRETLVQVERARAAAGDGAAAARADAFVREREACTVKPPPRY